MRHFILALVLLSAACTARTPPAAPATSPTLEFDDAADKLIRHGCYRCLEQAFEQAQRHGARMQAFEAATLLTLRSKELGLPSDEWLNRARTLAGTDASLSPYLEIVDVIPPDRLSENRDALFDIRRRSRAKCAAGCNSELAGLSGLYTATTRFLQLHHEPPLY